MGHSLTSARACSLAKINFKLFPAPLVQPSLRNALIAHRLGLSTVTLIRYGVPGPAQGTGKHDQPPTPSQFKF